MVRCRFLCLFACLVGICVGVNAAAAGPGAAAEATLGQDELDAHFTRLDAATTEAQRFVFLKRAREAIKGRTVELTFTVDEVRPVVFKDSDVFAVEGVNADPAYVVKFYLADEDAAIGLNVGDEVTMRGTGFGFFYSGKNKSISVDQAEPVASEPAAAPEPTPPTGP